MTMSNHRLIDRWFPVAAVDAACRTPAGSGRVEKAIFTWFASRPIAQARAAALTTLLPADDAYRPDVNLAVRSGDAAVMKRLAAAIRQTHGDKAPVVLDMFSGRAIIPLEVARAGANAVGIDLSPVATLAGRLLADYPARDWIAEPGLPFNCVSGANSGTNPRPLPVIGDGPGAGNTAPRLVSDVELFLAEVGRRTVARVERSYPRNEHGAFPWGYLWALTMPCDGCRRRFPLIGSFVLRHPYRRLHDNGQSLRLLTQGDAWSVEVIDGPPAQTPTYVSADLAGGKKRKGKAARCPFCRHVHPLEAVKGKGELGEYDDALLAVADQEEDGVRFFRLPTDRERAAATTAVAEVRVDWPYQSVPDEVIPDGNVHTVMASGYGYRRFGELMNNRQRRLFIETTLAIRSTHCDALKAGISTDYGRALASFAAAVLCRQIRRSTRGARLMQHGSPEGKANNRVQADHVFTNESKINFQFDYFEAGPGEGSGTWSSVSETAVQSLRKLLEAGLGAPARLRSASATSLPFRDGSMDAVITDPPYYDMIEYADASDLFHTWLKRVLFDIEPDLFGPDTQQPDGLQNKNDEIIVRRVHEPGRIRHDTAFYECMLARSFEEARRVLKPTGHLVVVFGHSDPEAWKRLLGALHSAGFVVTSAWPSRTESGNADVTSIRVTVTIGCRVAPARRPVGTAAQVDLEVAALVGERVRQWDADGLALEDQLMASYGPAMEVFGRYARVLNPDGSPADVDHYLTVARRAVRDAMRLQVDALPLETFDAVTRFALFWLRAKGRTEVPKGEALFFAQADHLRLAELRDRILTESKVGFRLRLDDSGPVREQSSTVEVARAMAYAWETGGAEAVAATIAQSGRSPGDPHLWAVIADLAVHLPASDRLALAMAGIKRSSRTIGTLVRGVPPRVEQMAMDELLGREG